MTPKMGQEAGVDGNSVEVRDEINRLLGEKGMSRAELARRTGEKYKNVQRWLSGATQRVPWSFVAKASEVLGGTTLLERGTQVSTAVILKEMVGLADEWLLSAKILGDEGRTEMAAALRLAAAQLRSKVGQHGVHFAGGVDIEAEEEAVHGELIRILKEGLTGEEPLVDEYDLHQAERLVELDQRISGQPLTGPEDRREAK